MNTHFKISFAKRPDLFPKGWILIISSLEFRACVFVLLYRSGQSYPSCTEYCFGLIYIHTLQLCRHDSCPPT